MTYKSSATTEGTLFRPTREHWANPLEFFLSCVGYSVGLGNIWRFPYVCMQNGGAAFLIPYFIFLAICGMPLFFLEMVVGQYLGSSCISVWNICPIFKGIGWGMIIVSGVACLYFNIIMAWVLYYLFASFRVHLPWKTCGNYWNTDKCFSYYDMKMMRKDPSYIPTSPNSAFINFMNSTNSTGPRMRSSAEEYWLFNVLNVSRRIEEVGSIQWPILLCFLLAWLMTYLCLIKGIKSSGKIVYITALAPYFFLTLILVNGVSLPGSWLGLEFYFIPKWESLLTWEIWTTAAMQIFFSLGPGWGGIIVMASYNRFDHRVMRDGFIIPVVCCLTSFYGGIAIFSVIGNMAYEANITDIEKVFQVGPGLAFVAYPEALAQLPGGPFWSILFFLMLITMGLDTMFATFETITTGFADEFPNLIGKYKNQVTLLMVIVMTLMGIIFTTRSGIFFFQIIDWYSAAISVMFLAYFEVIVLCYIYGVRNVWNNMEEMLGKLSVGVKYWWGIAWGLLSPCVLQLVVVGSLYYMKAPKMGEHTYPGWAIGLGWTIASLSVMPVLICALWLIHQRGVAHWRDWFRPNAKFYKLLRSAKERSGLTAGITEGVAMGHVATSDDTGTGPSPTGTTPLDDFGIRAPPAYPGV